MTVELTNGDWRWTGAQRGGPCPLRTSVPDGLNNVDWRLDPSAEPLTGDSTAISLLVTERECVSGQVLGERLVGPDIVTTDTAVLLAFAAEAPPGMSQDCQGNPEQSVVAQLSEPLGDRTVSDGLAVAGYLEDYLD